MRKKRKYVDNGVVIATVIVTLLFVISAGYLLGGDNLVMTVLDKDSTAKTFYFLTTDGYEDVTVARQSAELIRNRGGAGYVDMKENNRIILAVYPDEQSANTVREKVGDDSLIVSSLSVSSINTGVGGTDMKDDVKKALTYFDVAFNSLYNLSNSLADSKVTVEDVSVQIGVLRSQIDDIKSVFYEKTKNSNNEKITEIKVALVTCLAIIDGVETEDFASTLSSLRRQTVQLVYCYHALANTLG